MGEGTVRWVAEQVIRQHEEPVSEHRATGRCAQCAPEGEPTWCELLHWARLLLLGDGLSPPHS